MNNGNKTAAGVTPVAPAPAANPGPAFGSDCKTVITREQFDGMFAALFPAKPDAQKWRFANQFPDMLVFSEKGRDQGYEQKANFQEKVRHGYLQALAQFTIAQMQEDINQTSDADVQKYYKDHSDRFEEFHLAELSFPKQRKHPPATLKPGAPDPLMARIAASIRKEAVAGGNIEALEDKGYVMAGYTKDESPDTDTGAHWTIDDLPVQYKSLILTFKAGQVSQVMDTPEEYVILKLISRKMPPPERIRQMYSSMMMQEATQAIRKSVTIQLNPDYFQKPKGGPPDSTP